MKSVNPKANQSCRTDFEAETPILWPPHAKNRLLGRTAMTNLDCMLKRKDITLPTKVCLVKATVFPEVMYRCESWTIKKAEHRRMDAFKLWC